MKNVKDQVYAKLLLVDQNVSDIYPLSFEKMPAIMYTEESNTVYTKTDNTEQLSYLRYRVDIWNDGSTSQLALSVDEKMSSLGLTRIECTDVAEPTRLRHKQLRYEGIMDVVTEQVYWNNNR